MVRAAVRAMFTYEARTVLNSIVGTVGARGLVVAEYYQMSAACMRFSVTKERDGTDGHPFNE
jgi:hypothetical protein